LRSKSWLKKYFILQFTVVVIKDSGYSFKLPEIKGSSDYCIFEVIIKINIF